MLLLRTSHDRCDELCKSQRLLAACCWPRRAASAVGVPHPWIRFQPQIQFGFGGGGCCSPPLGCDFEDGEAGFAHPLSLNSSPLGQAPSRSPSGKRRRCCTRQGRAPRGENFLALPPRADVCAANPFCSLPTCAAPFTPPLAELGRFRYTQGPPLLGLSNPEPASAGAGVSAEAERGCSVSPGSWHPAVLGRGVGDEAAAPQRAQLQPRLRRGWRLRFHPLHGPRRGVHIPWRAGCVHPTDRGLLSPHPRPACFLAGSRDLWQAEPPPRVVFRPKCLAHGSGDAGHGRPPRALLINACHLPGLLPVGNRGG